MFLQDFSVGQSGRVSTRNHAKPSYEIYGFPVPSGKLTMPFIVDLPIENGGSFHSYVKVYQRVPLMTAFGQVAAAAEASSCCFLAKITGMYKYQTHEFLLACL